MKRSVVVASSMVGVLAAWMISGVVKPKHEITTAKRSGHQAMSVEVKNSLARMYTPRISAQGQALPNSEVTLRAQTTGMVARLLKNSGERVVKGTVIATIELGSRQATLAKAKAKVNERKATYLALKHLGGKGYSAKTRIKQAQADYQEALAELAEAKLELARCQIRAPFAGIISQKFIEVGDYLTPNSAVVALVDNSKLIVSVDIPQHQIAAVKLATKANVSLATGVKLDGQVRFIAPKAKQATRTFRVEIAVDNPQGYASGISATAEIPTKPLLAHYLPPSVLVLGLGGELGVMSVDVEGLVKFNPVHLVSAQSRGVWLSGLPNSVRLITRGQGFVDEGQLVRYRQQNKHQFAAKSKKTNKGV